MTSSPCAPRRQRPHVVALNPRGQRAPLLLIPGVTGFSFPFRELAAMLSVDRPVYGLQLPGADPREPILPYSIEQMAQLLAAQCFDLCPGQPLLLAGYSMGALLAFELSHLLQKHGRQVPLLISIDGTAPGFPAPAQAGARLRAHVHALRQRPRGYLASRASILGRKLLAPWGQDFRLVESLPGADRQTNARFKKLVVVRERASACYRPRLKLPTELLLLRVKDADLPLGARDDPYYGWSAHVAGPLSVVSIPGDHHHLLEISQSRDAVARAVAAHLRPVPSSFQASRLVSV